MSLSVSCPHAAPCGRCPNLARSVQEAATGKSARVQGAVALMGAAGAGLVAERCLPAEQTQGILHAVELVARAQAGRKGAQVGFPADVPGGVLDIPGCILLAPALRPLLEALRQGHPPFSGDVVARCGSTGSAQLLLVRGDGRDRLGSKRVELEVAGVQFRLSASSPAPANPDAVALEVAAAATWFRSRGPLLALAAGAGIHALPLAKQLGVRAVLLDESISSCGDASLAAEKAGIIAETRAGELRQEISRLLPEAGPYRAVLVTAPPAGLSLQVLEQVARACRERMVWVADNPEVAARDLSRLRLFGLRPTRLIPSDRNPLSDDVAVVALLERETDGWTPPVLHDDDACVVVAKPTGIASTGRPSVDSLLLARDGGERHRWPVHRLDAGTSGALLFAKSKAGLSPLSAQFAASDVERHYLVLVAGRPRREAGVIDKKLPEPGGGRLKPARTRWWLDRRVGDRFSLLRVQVETGRTHQIRRHLAGIGHGVVGDGRYGDATVNSAALRVAALDHPFVHAAVLAFESPASGAVVRVEAPLPPLLRWALERLAEK